MAYVRKHRIGSGAKSVVYQAVKNKVAYAMKINKNPIPALEQEVMSKAHHPNIIRCYETLSLIHI